MFESKLVVSKLVVEFKQREDGDFSKQKVGSCRSDVVPRRNLDNPRLIKKAPPHLTCHFLFIALPDFRFQLEKHTYLRIYVHNHHPSSISADTPITICLPPFTSVYL